MWKSFIWIEDNWSSFCVSPCKRHDMWLILQSSRDRIWETEVTEVWQDLKRSENLRLAELTTDGSLNFLPRPWEAPCPASPSPFALHLNFDLIPFVCLKLSRWILKSDSKLSQFHSIYTISDNFTAASCIPARSGLLFIKLNSLGFFQKERCTTSLTLLY